MVFFFGVFFQLLYLSIGLAVFKSLFPQNRPKGIALLIVLVLGSLYLLTVGYSLSIALGITMTLIALAMGAITVIMMKKDPSFSSPA